MAETDAVPQTDQHVKTQDDNDSADDLQPGIDEEEAQSEEPAKKRRRVVKPNPDKKFECKHEGCGKSYSRAEHLYRHQLNRKLS